MNVLPISNFRTQQYFGENLLNNQSVVPKQNNVSHAKDNKLNQPSNTYTKKQLIKYTATAGASALVLGTVILNPALLNKLYHMRCKNLDYQMMIRNLQDTVGENEKKINTLTDNNKFLKKELNEVKNKFNEIFESDITPSENREKIENEIVSDINSEKLDYDITNPPIVGKKSQNIKYDPNVEVLSLPKFSQTTNRINMQKLTIPEISPNGAFEFKMPNSEEMQIAHVKSKDFEPVDNQLTNITESYADSVQWNNDKISRDILQNFFDGHGHTLDGVEFHFEPVPGGKYKVKIKGKSTYSVDKAVFIGESTKRDDVRAAGNYGEGLKMAVLKLLKDKGATDVKIKSDNWALTYKLSHSDLSDKRVLAYSIDKVPDYDGNSLEFVTDDKNLLETLRKTVNRFYHSRNVHFKCPNFENEVLGLKVLAPNEKGGIYIAGQRFEYNNDFDGLDGFVLFLKEKPPADVLDISRDRTSLNAFQLNSIAMWIIRHPKMSNVDKASLLKTLESNWDYKQYTSQTDMDSFLERLVQGCGCYTDFKIKFPQNYVAYSDATDEVVADLRQHGYKVCLSSFADIGMPTLKDVVGEARKHDVVNPDSTQLKKILIIKEAIKKLSSSLSEHFTEDELDTKLYMFDNQTYKEKKLFDTVDAQAIIDNGLSKGFWIDKNYLNESSFSEVLETALHELSHKAGGDESPEFSYQLTRVNRSAIEQMLTDAQTRMEMQILNKLWDNLPVAE